MALTRRIGFARFDRFGGYLGRLDPKGVTSAVHTDALDGTDELKITCSEDLKKGERLVWIDRRGVCHEHIVDQTERTHEEAGKPATQATCINSVNETWDDWVDDKRPSGTARVALTSILEGTRWEVGTCDQPGTASHTFYHQSVREALGDLVDTWGGEVETTIRHAGATVTGRSVGIRSMRGDQDSPKRFTWTKDLVSVRRTVASDNPKSRVYCYGKGVETESGAYGRRLTIADVNGGKTYVEDAEATALYGHPDGKGGTLPSCTSYVNEECEDPAQLMAEGLAYLKQVKEPKVTYTASVIDLEAFGRSWEGVGVGDAVAIIDKGFSKEGVRLRGRVSQIERDLLTGDATVTFGNLADAMADMWQGVSSALRTSRSQAALLDAVASASPSWLTQLQAALNAQYNSVGTYHVESFELGEIWSNVALDQSTGLPVKSTSGMWAVNINGMGIRLAASLTSGGEWDWKTFVTGEGATADLINVGILKADLIKAGVLQDATGNNWWNFETGDMRWSGYATSTDLTTATSKLISSVDVLYAINDSATEAPADGWQTDPPAWVDGRYIWAKTRTTKGGVSSDTEPVCVTGPKGATGEAGKDGRSVVVRSATKSGKVTTVVLAGSDGSTTTLTIDDGADGSDGKPGEAGADGTTWYTHFAWATSADGSEGFVTANTESAGKTYLGVCSTTDRADPTDASAYSWSRIKGDTGATGKGVSAIAEQYYLSTSDTAQSGGSWSVAQPTWTSGHYMWTRSAVTWTDGTTTYTEPQRAKAIDSANETAATAKETADGNSDTLMKLQTQEAIFNLLTKNGTLKGLYMQDGVLYINADLIKSGTIDASLIKAGILTVGKAGSHVTKISVLDSDGKETISISPSGILVNTTSNLLTSQVYYSMVPSLFGGMFIGRNSTGTGQATIISPQNICVKNNSDAVSLTGLTYPSTNIRPANVYIADSAYGTSGQHYISLEASSSSCGISTSGTIMASGTKSRKVSTEDYGDRLLYCYETPSPMFGDVGEGVIGDDGTIYVQLDPTFSETVSTDSYQVALQPYGDGEAYVSERAATHFVVKGTSGLSFGWEVKAKQSDFDQLRLESYAEADPEAIGTDYGTEAITHITTVSDARKAEAA